MKASDTELAAGVQKVLRSKNVRSEEGGRVFNGAVHMRFGGEVHDPIELLLPEKIEN